MFFLLENWTRIAYVNEDLPALSKEIRFMRLKDGVTMPD